METALFAHRRKMKTACQTHPGWQAELKVLKHKNSDRPDLPDVFQLHFRMRSDGSRREGGFGLVCGFFAAQFTQWDKIPTLPPHCSCAAKATTTVAPKNLKVHRNHRVTASKLMNYQSLSESCPQGCMRVMLRLLILQRGNHCSGTPSIASLAYYVSRGSTATDSSRFSARCLGFPARGQCEPGRHLL